LRQPTLDSNPNFDPEGAEIPFDNILDRVTGSDPSVTDYILEAPAKCPTASVRFSKRLSLNPRDVSPQSLLPLVRRLLEMGL
jgi:hypothetical protein